MIRQSSEKNKLRTQSILPSISFEPFKFNSYKSSSERYHCKSFICISFSKRRIVIVREISNLIHSRLYQEGWCDPWGLVWPLWGEKRFFHLVKKSGVLLTCKGLNSTRKEFGLVDWNLKWCAWGVDVGQEDRTTINRRVWISLPISLLLSSFIFFALYCFLNCSKLLIWYNF